MLNDTVFRGEKGFVSEAEKQGGNPAVRAHVRFQCLGHDWAGARHIGGEGLGGEDGPVLAGCESGEQEQQQKHHNGFFHFPLTSGWVLGRDTVNTDPFPISDCT